MNNDNVIRYLVDFLSDHKPLVLGIEYAAMHNLNPMSLMTVQEDLGNYEIMEFSEYCESLKEMQIHFESDEELEKAYFKYCKDMAALTQPKIFTEKTIKFFRLCVEKFGDMGYTEYEVLQAVRKENRYKFN